MRQGFRKTLENYRDHIVDYEKKSANNIGEDALTRLEIAADVAIERRAEEIGSKQEHQQEIFAMQEKKQALMNNLYRDLAAMDNGEAEEKLRLEHTLPVKFDREKMNFLVGEHGKEETASVGELLTDGDWGIQYFIDPKDSSIPRSVRKRFFIEQTKRELQDLLNEQIIVEETTRSSVNEPKSKSYEAIANEPEALLARQSGRLAEKLVLNLFSQLQFDAPGVIKVIPADIYEDVNQKIDFILQVKAGSNRGVKAEGADNPTIGIQFTTNLNRENLDYKRNQVSKTKKSGDLNVNDIVLVVLPIESIKDVIYNYEKRKKEAGKVAGGPLNFLVREEVEYLIRGVLNNLVPDEEIDKIITSLEPQLHRRSERLKDEEQRMNRSLEVLRIRYLKHIQEQLGQTKKPAVVTPQIEQQPVKPPVMKPKIDKQPVKPPLSPKALPKKKNAKQIEKEALEAKEKAERQRLRTERHAALLLQHREQRLKKSK